MRIERGSDAVDKVEAAKMFWGAFREKLLFCLGPDDKALRFLEDNIHPTFSFAAFDQDRLVGLIGFKTSRGGLIGGEFSDLARVYGTLSTLWRVVILSMFERDLKDDQLLLDGIFVTEQARGLGVGTALIQAIKGYAQAEGYSEIRLDVIDTNPRAKALYVREGFTAAGQVKAGLFKGVLGFSSATTMVFKVPSQTSRLRAQAT